MKKVILLFLVLLVSLVTISLTSCASPGKIKKSAKEGLTVEIKSNPTKASIYEVDERNQLGRKLGTTPIKLRYSYEFNPFKAEIKLTQEITTSQKEKFSTLVPFHGTDNGDWIFNNEIISLLSRNGSIFNPKRSILKIRYAIIKEGYTPQICEKTLREAISGGKPWANPYRIFEKGETSLFSTLRKIGSPPIISNKNLEKQQNSQNNKECEEAIRNYNSAVERYQKAKRDARESGILHDGLGKELAIEGAARKFGIFGALIANNLANRETEIRKKELEEAKEELENAKARMDNCK